jgi:hypothetical protein
MLITHVSRSKLASRAGVKENDAVTDHLRAVMSSREKRGHILQSGREEFSSDCKPYVMNPN